MVITFCGHSNYKFEIDDEIKLLNILEELSTKERIDFYLGGYGNFDSFAKNCAKKFKENHPDSKLIFITPYLNKWLEERKANLEKEYDDIIYPALERVPLKFAISKRNEWMVRQSNIVICYVSAHHGGAYKTLLYAHKHKKTYINLYKGNFEIY